MNFKPMAHQEEGIARAYRRPFFAHCAEQGTGKTYMSLSETETYFEKGWLEGLLIVAPKGVHTNWTTREIPKLLSTRYMAAAWEQTKRYRKKMEEMFATKKRVLKILAINIDAVNTQKGFDEAARFLRSQKSEMIVDESIVIKSPDSKRTARVIALGRLAACRRILNGTLIVQSPFDVFSQFEFLEPDRAILGHSTYRSFVAHYGVLLPPDNELVKHAMSKARGKLKEPPQIVQRKSNGEKMYRNLEELREILAPHIYRVRKRDCLDLPEKIYTQRAYELGPKTKAAYAQLDDKLPIDWDGEQLPVREEARLMKAMQVASGFMLTDDDGVIDFDEGKNGKLRALEQVIGESSGEQIILWAHFRYEFEKLRELLSKQGLSFVEYHGEVPKSRREQAIDSFQKGRRQVFLASAAAAGMGLTLTAASIAIYYTNTFNLWHRLQSEDRPHRIGTRNPVLYIDFVCPGTITHAVLTTLDRKRRIGEEVVG